MLSKKGKPVTNKPKASKKSGAISGSVRSIEEEIRQTRPFTSSQHKAVVNLLFTYGWATERLREVLMPFDMTMQQYNVLRILRGAERPISTSDIRERMLDRMSDSSRLVDRLEKKGWATRHICPADKRLVDIEITELGLARLKAIDQQQGGMSVIGNGLSNAQAEKLSSLLDQLRQGTP